MEESIEEALKQGYIRPSSSPAAYIFFFVGKKDPEPGRPSPPRSAGPPKAPSVPSVPKAREMRVPSAHGAVPRLHHWRGGYPNGRGEGNSSYGVADSPVC